jgi:hypothetical protein
MSVKVSTDFSEEAAPPQRPVAWVDRVGICVSAACAVHCLAMPVLLALGPAMSSIFLVGHGLERVLAIGAVLTAVACLCWGYRIHGKKRLIVSFLAAAVFILAGQLVAEGWLETVLVVTGGLGLIGSHLLNRALCKSCDHCCSH